MVITPAQNEAAYLGQTIDSLTAQTLLPQEWVIVDDGSVDETFQIAQQAARTQPWIKVVQRGPAKSRRLGAGVVEAFDFGLRQVSRRDYTFIFKIDADIVLGPRYFQTILSKFTENPRLGVATGVVYQLMEGREVKTRWLPLGVAGAVKCWRRQCFEEIGGLVPGLAWDGIDSFEALRLGWQAQTFEDPELKVWHLRPEGSSVKSRSRGWVRRGQAMHFVGAHPLWVWASAFYHMAERPFILGGICMLLGYLGAFLQRAPRYENLAFRRFLRRWQLKYLAGSLRLA
ncbi:MAG: glycosyltransferase family 2 protein [Deltaproteobacteria bacterium]|nr:glycosyltransferase family 2 protein [Deltaproteobacteria bacterium]